MEETTNGKQYLSVSIELEGEIDVMEPLAALRQYGKVTAISIRGYDY